MASPSSARRTWASRCALVPRSEHRAWPSSKGAVGRSGRLATGSRMPWRQGSLRPGRAPLARVVHGAATGQSGGIVFTFPGDGEGWRGMALELLDSSPVFTEEIRACDQALSNYVDWSREEVFGGARGAPGHDRADVPPLSCSRSPCRWRPCGVRWASISMRWWASPRVRIAAAYAEGVLLLTTPRRSWRCATVR